MFRVFLTALMIWALSFSGSNCGSARVQSPPNVEQSPQQTPPNPERKEAGPVQPTIKLSTDAPNGSFALDPNLIPPSADVLEISITKVVNASQTPVSIFVYLDDNEEKSDRDVERVPLGSFSLYPPDRPGKFLLPVPLSRRKLMPGSKVLMTFELKRVDETKPGTKVEVEMSPPNWRSDQKQSPAE